MLAASGCTAAAAAAPLLQLRFHIKSGSLSSTQLRAGMSNKHVWNTVFAFVRKLKKSINRRVLNTQHGQKVS